MVLLLTTYEWYEARNKLNLSVSIFISCILSTELDITTLEIYQVYGREMLVDDDWAFTWTLNTE